MNVSRAEELLRLADAQEVRLERHLLVAAALREVLAHEPVVVGGTAEEFYTVDEYHETDLDLCTWLSSQEEAFLSDLGFEQRGRHWVHQTSKVAVEFPESRIAGDETRIRRESVESGVVAIIGVEDLYLDRVRQATADSGGGRSRTAPVWRSGPRRSTSWTGHMSRPRSRQRLTPTLDWGDP